MKSPSIISALKKNFSFLTKKEKLKWSLIALFAFGNSLIELVTASLVVVFAQVLSQPSIGNTYLSKLGFSKMSPNETILTISMTLGGVYLLKNIYIALEAFFQNLTIQKLNYDFKERLLLNFTQSDYANFMSRNSAFGLNIVSSDAEQIYSVGMTSISSILSESIIFFSLLLMIIYLNPDLLIIVASIVFAITFVLMKWVLPSFYRWGKNLQEVSLHVSRNLLQFFHGYKEIILLGKKDYFANSFLTHAKKRGRIQALQTATNTLPRVVIETLFMCVFVITVVFLCLKSETPTQMMGVFGGYLYVGFRLMPGLNRMINHLNAYKSIIPAIERVYQEYNTETTKNTYIDEPQFHFQEEIGLKNVYFRYLNTEKDALENISVTIKKGEWVGIIGETGSGKSTLVDVILGLLKPRQGDVLIDNQHQANSIQWHKMIGYVPQSVYLVDDTIAANIAFGEEEINKDYLDYAIKAAQLEGLINKLPEGYHTLVGERGVRLSGGEKQRIAIARALYHHPEVLVFDEATSALDSEIEAKLMQTIREVGKNRTVIMIAHRLTTLKDCSRILVMHSGKLERETKYQYLPHQQAHENRHQPSESLCD